MDNVTVYRKDGEKGVNYMMFIEYKGLRFAKPWTLGFKAELDPADVAEIMCADAHDELERFWDEVKNVGEPIEWPLPAWIEEEKWEKFEF